MPKASELKLNAVAAFAPHAQHAIAASMPFMAYLANAPHEGVQPEPWAPVLVQYFLSSYALQPSLKESFQPGTGSAQRGAAASPVVASPARTVEFMSCGSKGRAPSDAATGLAVAPPTGAASLVLGKAKHSKLFPLVAIKCMRAHGPSGNLLFASGRIAGWLAHAMEQLTSGQLIRPRATYTGD